MTARLLADMEREANRQRNLSSAFQTCGERDLARAATSAALHLDLAVTALRSAQVDSTAQNRILNEA